MMKPVQSNKKATRKVPWASWCRNIEFALENRGWTVDYIAGAPDAAYYPTKTIQINKNHTPEIKFYMLSHEFGHVVVSGKKKYIEKHYMALTRQYGQLQYRVAVVSEEVAAWDAGYEWVVTNIGHEAIKQRYWITRGSMLSGYMMWVTIRKMANAEYYKRSRDQKAAAATNCRAK
jgi:hypothetical protein